MKTEFGVSGMHCASCAVKSEDALKRVPGVKDASVNYALQKASVEFDPKMASMHDLHGAVASLGYEVSDMKAHGEHVHDHGAEWSTARNALLLALPSVLIGMGWLVFPGAEILNLVITTIVVFVFGRTFHASMAAEMRQGSPGMESLVSLGTLSAYGLSLVNLVRGGHGYFETATVITAFILLGDYFEAQSRSRAASGIERLLALGAAKARRLTAGGEEEVEVAALAVGDRVLVKPGETIPQDGVIEEGVTEIDESMVTGESLPVPRKAGDAVIGATVNGAGAVTVRVTRVGDEAMLARIVKMVSDAQMVKSPIERLTDRVSRVFVPIVIALAALTWIAWFALGYGVSESVLAAVSVLVVACPCALGLATPTAVMVGTGAAAERGILIRNASVLEKTHAVTEVVFDKTGTLTEGKPRITSIEPLGSADPNAVLRLACAIEAQSEHPISHAFGEIARERNLLVPKAERVRALTGRGVVGVVEGHEVLVAAGQVIVDGKASLAFTVADVEKADAKRAIAMLQESRIGVSMLTGDKREIAEAVATRLHVQRVLAEVKPDGKVAAVRALQAEGKKVAFVGDGVNDAPVLAASDLGIAMGTGSQVAIETGDIVLLGGSPALVPEALRLSKLTFRTIKQNLFWAFIYNVIALPIAALGGLTPMLAAALMAFSSVSVVLNSLAIRFTLRTRTNV